MNSPLRKVSVMLALMMAALLLNLTWFSAVQAPKMNAHSANRRVRDAEFSQDRGTILVGNTPIAETRRVKGTFPYVRKYPDGHTWSSITGWYSYDFARAELEQSWNEEMAGTASGQVFTRVVDLLSGRTPRGLDLRTGLNEKAQKAAILALGNQQGAAIAMNYETGQILALASTPTYDPNLLSSTDLKREQQSWAELLKAPGDPLKNRATREIFPPGSTFKLVTAAAAIENGMSAASKVKSPDHLPLPGTSHRITNSTDCGGSEITLQQALATSCNTAFANVGLSVGSDKLRATAEAFGFGKAPDLDLPTVASRFPDELDKAQLAQSSIGQFDVASTPLQMLMVTSAIANDGVMMKPHIVTQLRTRDLRPVRNITPTHTTKPISPNTAKQLQQMMQSVVTDGTGRPARMDGLTIGGKTGTAQTAPNRPPYAWFVGYAQELKVAVVVFVQSTDAQRNDISGGRIAAPVFRAIVEALR